MTKMDANLLLRRQQYFGDFLATSDAKKGGIEVALAWRHVFRRVLKALVSQEHNNKQNYTGWISIIEEAALEELARGNEGAYWQHMEFLAAYIRAQASWKETSQPQQPSLCPSSNVEAQAILAVFGRREKICDRREQRWLNLRRTDLWGMSLPNANLQGLDLTGAHLEGVDLWGADLRGAMLPRAYLTGAFLAGARLEGANLVGIHLEKAFLRDAHLQGTLLTGVHLDGAVLWSADLRGATLWGAHLEGADLLGANLRRANLTRVTGLTAKQIASAYIDEETRLPEKLSV